MNKVVSTYLKKRYEENVKNAPIYIKYYYEKGKQKLFHVGYIINEDDWDSKKNLVKLKHPDSEEINNAIEKLSHRIKEIVRKAKENDIDPTIDYVVEEFEKKTVEKNAGEKNIDFFEQLDIYISEQERLRGYKEVLEYRSMRKHLNGFKEEYTLPITFNNLDIQFYEEFLYYLNNKAVRRDGEVGVSNNTAGKYIKALKAFVHDRVKKRIISPIDLSDFKRIQEETNHIYVDEIDLYNIYKLDLSNSPELDKTRDLFVVGCFTGLRFSDLSNIGPQHIDSNEDVIRKKTGKNDKLVTIPIIDYVPKILKKYNNDLPHLSMNEFNKNIKKIGELAGLNQEIEIVSRKGKKVIKKVFSKYEKIASHTCRRSFCTNMFNSGNPAEEVMRISGHSKHTTFMTYIKTTDLQVANNIKKRRENRLEEIEKMAGQKKMNENRE